MNELRLLSAAVAIIALSVTSVAAQGNSASAPKTSAPKPSAPKTTTPSSGGKATTPAQGGKSVDRGADAGRNAKVPGTSNAGAATTSDGTAGDATAAGAGSTLTAAAVPNAISTKIAKNPERAARVQGLLPAGMSLEQASAGFRNEGQFMAALNASRNRGIPLAALQEEMTVKGLSLGAAVRSIEASAASAGDAGGSATAGAQTSTGASTSATSQPGS